MERKGSDVMENTMRVNMRCICEPVKRERRGIQGYGGGGSFRIKKL